MIESKRFAACSRVLGGLAVLLALSEAPAAVFENLYTVTVPLSFEVLEDQEPLTEADRSNVLRISVLKNLDLSGVARALKN